MKNKTLIMGILNITPNSFSDGGDFLKPENAIDQAKKMIEEGADIVDIGAESTAPNAEKISEEKEWNRLQDIIPILKNNNIPLSLDSYKSEIWKKSVQIDEKIIFNDVSGLEIEAEEKIQILQKYPQTKIIIMFSRDISLPDPINIMNDICNFFTQQIKKLENAGIEKNRIIIDPGMGGFVSKNPEISFQIIRGLETLQQFQCKILIGTSRKSFLREISHPTDSKKRVIASVITALECIKNGANIVRVHDVQEMKEGIKCCKYLL